MDTINTTLMTPLLRNQMYIYASSVTPHIWPWFPNSCLYLILEVFDIDLCSMECYFPRSRARKVTFRALERGEWLSMLWDLGFCKCQHSQFTYSLLIKRNLTIFERVPLPQPEMNPGPLASKASALPLDLHKLSWNEWFIRSYRLWTQQSLCDCNVRTKGIIQ